ncbi:Concanavalin A-like lectin/glucanases superfamily protein [Streptosporangium subroseum]|uniref:Concanavalin A-like lectin/glucanases superfamily protein n=1 Tax=Streptosporangium subroseum TaxID=106412 RepID=A0A239DBT4_9ACTN|nr:LamG-like jellyroll fold domain-containing protein [Streptosporangium subroseum]SNS29780.1 Concanavalin A-like lectin/glucanases superfamily protein [Streptosporangium subroseum]
MLALRGVVAVSLVGAVLAALTPGSALATPAPGSALVTPAPGPAPAVPAQSLAPAVESPAATTGRAVDPALVRARQTGQPAEVEALRSETRQVFVKPDGTYVLEQNVRPVRVRQAGRWVPVDTTLREQPDGTVAPAATAVGLAFSGGGNANGNGGAPLARMSRGGKAMELGWSGTLPKPVLNGDTATYPEVMPGVDLQVTADVDGFSHILVVKSRAAAASSALSELTFPLSTSGLSMESDQAGNLEAVDDNGGTIFVAPTPMMWDSEGATSPQAFREGRAPEARQAQMGVKLAGRTLRLRPDRKLMTDPKTRFPIYLDPYFSAARGSWTAVWSNWPDSNYLNSSDVARAGHVESQKNRSFFQMSTGSTIHGKQIIKATLRTYETWSYSCSARKVEAWATNSISKSTTWNKQPAWVTKLSTVNVAKGWGPSCLPGGVEFDVTPQVVDAAAKKWPTVTIGIRATSETDVYAWKKFKNNPTLVIEYNSLPADPVAVDAWSDPGGPCVSGTGRPIISTATPKLWAKLKDVDNSVRGRFEWYNEAGTKTGEYLTALGSTGTAFSATVPQSLYSDGALIRWRVRAEDGKANSLWSPWCEATVDATAPGREPIVTSPGFAENGWSDGVGLAGSFTFDPNGISDVAAYVYGLDTSPKTEVAPGTDGTATIQLTPRHDGPNVLSVRSKDRAGQLGPIRTYVFNVNSGSAPKGHWPLDEGQGTVGADIAGTHPATLYGATWASGKTGMGLRLANAYAQTSGPIVDTGRNFTVTAWARLTGTGATATAVTQEGGRTGAFSLQYSKTDDRWALTRTGSDVDAATTVRALSTAAPRLNEWTHLAGVYDSADRRLSLYVNGKLESSAAFTTQPWNAAGPLTIGRGKVNGAAAEFFPGDIDEVRAYGRAMFADEVADLVNSAATLIGHWRLDEESGLSAADSSGRATAAPATLTGGASWTAGWLDGALALDGVNGYAQTTAPVVNTRSGFTVTAWTQLDYLPTRDTAAVAQPGSRAAGFQLGYDKEQGRWALGMAAADTDTAALVRTRSDAIPAPLEWTHVAGVYDPLAGQLRIYVNGQLSTTTVTSHTSAWNATGPLQLGRSKTAGVFTGYWPGTVDDVRTYDGVLKAEQIAQLAAQ